MRISKKILAIALSILMAVSMMPFTVFAEDVPEGTTYSYTNTSGVTTYKTDTFPTSLSDGTYKLYQDVETPNRISVGTFIYDVTIDLNGHSITSTADNASYPGAIYVGRAGSATKHRSFSVINTSSTPATITNTVGDGVCVNGNFNDFYLGENVTMTTKGTGVWVTTKTNDTVTIDGAVVSTEEFGVYVNGTNAGPNTVTVNGSVTGDDAGIYAAGVADYIVNGAVTGDTGIYQKGGNLTVNEGAVVTGTGAAAAYVENGNGMNSTGDAIVVENNAGYNYGSTTINGGTISSTEAGTSAISTPVASNVATASQEVQDRIDVDVKGGTFTEAGDPANVSEFVNENSDFDPATGVVTHYVASIGAAKYETFEAAWNAAADGNTITLLDDCAGNGLKAPQGKFATGLTVDFNGKTYTIDGSLVGSTGTQSQAFQLLKDNTITFKNGTIYSEKARMLVQNYSNLTLDNMVLTLNNTTTAPATVYTLSNNNGTVVIDDTTINANPVNTAYAFDVCRYSSYQGVDVTVTGNSVINGDVQIDIQNGDAKNGANLTLESGTMTGDIDLTAGAEAAINDEQQNAGVTKAAAFAAEAPEGFEWDTNGELVEDNHTVAKIGDVKYDTLEAAWNAAVDGDTITLVANCNGNGLIAPQNKFATNGLTVDLNSFTYTVDGNPVGSTGTETSGFQLLKGNKITFKDGTLYGDPSVNNTKLQRMIQNYADLTLDNVTVDMKGYYYDQITMANCNGTTTITNGSVVAAPDFTWLGYTDQEAADDLGAGAMTVGTFQGYTEVEVNVEDATIDGNLMVDPSNASATKNEVNLGSDSTVTGDILMQELATDEAQVKKEAGATVATPEGFEWDNNGVLQPIADAFNLTIEDKIHMNMYVNAQAYGADTITVTYSDPTKQDGTAKTDTLNVANLAQDTQGRYIISVLAAPAQITDTVTITAGDHSFTTSVKAYCDEIIAQSNDAELVELAKTMLDYGKAANAEFGYTAAAKFDAFNFVDYLDGNLYNKAVLDASGNAGVFTNYSYIVTSVPALRLYTSKTEQQCGNPDQVIYKATVTNTATNEVKEVAPTVITETGEVVIDIAGILAEDFDDVYVVEFMGSSIEINALAFAAAKGGDFGRSMYNYYVAADAYFN